MLLGKCLPKLTRNTLEKSIVWKEAGHLENTTVNEVHTENKKNVKCRFMSTPETTSFGIVDRSYAKCVQIFAGLRPWCLILLAFYSLLEWNISIHVIFLSDKFKSLYYNEELQIEVMLLLKEMTQFALPFS